MTVRHVTIAVAVAMVVAILAVATIDRLENGWDSGDATTRVVWNVENSGGDVGLDTLFLR